MLSQITAGTGALPSEFMAGTGSLAHEAYERVALSVVFAPSPAGRTLPKERWGPANSRRPVETVRYPNLL